MESDYRNALTFKTVAFCWSLTLTFMLNFDTFYTASGGCMNCHEMHVGHSFSQTFLLKHLPPGRCKYIGSQPVDEVA